MSTIHDKSRNQRGYLARNGRNDGARSEARIFQTLPYVCAFNLSLEDLLAPRPVIAEVFLTGLNEIGFDELRNSRVLYESIRRFLEHQHRVDGVGPFTPLDETEKPLLVFVRSSRGRWDVLILVVIIDMDKVREVHANERDTRRVSVKRLLRLADRKSVV